MSQSLKLRRGTVDRPTPRRPDPVLVAGLVLPFIVALADRLWSLRSIAEEGPPDLGAAHLARSATLAVSALLIAIGVVRTGLGPGTARRRSDPHILPRAAEERDTTAASTSETLLACGSSGIAAAAAALLIIAPETLNRLVSEDHIVEWLSALLCFVAAVLVGAAVARYWRRAPKTQPAHRGVAMFGTIGALLFLSVTFALFGLEEISWFQRVLDVESPEVFINRNGQKEINLHNFATTATGHGYYVGGFLLLVAGPWLLSGRLGPKLRWLTPLVPPRLVLLAAAPAGAVVYEMWDVVWIQLTFWLAIPAILLTGFDHRDRKLSALTISVMVTTLVVFLLQGDAMVRSWDDTEVRELILPYGFAVYGFGLLTGISVGESAR